MMNFLSYYIWWISYINFEQSSVTGSNSFLGKYCYSLVTIGYISLFTIGCNSCWIVCCISFLEKYRISLQMYSWNSLSTIGWTSCSIIA